MNAPVAQSTVYVVTNEYRNVMYALGSHEFCEGYLIAAQTFAPPEQHFEIVQRSKVLEQK